MTPTDRDAIILAIANYESARSIVGEVERMAYEQAGGPCLVAMDDWEMAQAQADYEVALQSLGWGRLMAQLSEAEDELVAAASHYITPMPALRRERLIAAFDVAA